MKGYAFQSFVHGQLSKDTFNLSLGEQPYGLNVIAREKHIPKQVVYTNSRWNVRFAPKPTWTLLSNVLRSSMLST